MRDSSFPSSVLLDGPLEARRGSDQLFTAEPQIWHITRISLGVAATQITHHALSTAVQFRA